MLEHYDAILNVAEAAEILRVGTNTVYSLMKTGELKAFRINYSWKIPKESIELYIRKSAGLE